MAEVDPVNAFWRDRPTLVTGASGLLGGWIVRRLLEMEAEVICLVRDWVPQRELVAARLLDRVRVVRGDVRHAAVVERTLGEYEVRTVLHLAAQTMVPVANRNPQSTFDTNIRGTWTVLEACRRSPTVSGIVVTSSDKAYGAHDVLPYDEDAPLIARHPYDVSKACGDLIAQSYASTFEMPVAITRCGNLFGGGDLNWNRLVPGTIRSVLRETPPVIRSDGAQLRDYLYVEDAAAAVLGLAERVSGEPRFAGQAFNFSNEQPQTVLELVRRILDLMDSTLEPIVQNRASHEIVQQYLSAARARSVLGWKPLFSQDEALGLTIDWYRGALVR